MGLFYSFFSLGYRKGFAINATSRSLYSPERETVPIVQEDGWAPGSVWTANTSTLKVTVIRISANENYTKYGSRNITIRQSIHNPDSLT